MLTEQRKQFLLAHLKRHGRIVAKEMSDSLGVSEDTVRRDLRELAAAGQLLRVHGGALPLSPTVKSLSSRRTIAADEKRALGQAAARHLHPGQTIFVDGGTTNLELVGALPTDMALTIVTHSPTIAAALEAHANIRVILVGGLLYKHSMVAIGAGALETIAAMRFDRCYVGANGFHPDEGLTTGDFEEAIVKRAIVQRSAEAITLITSDKIGCVAANRICAIAALTEVFILRSAAADIPADIGPTIVAV